MKKWANETPLKAAQAAWHAAFILYEANFSPLPFEVPSSSGGKGEEGKEREGKGGIIIDSFHHPWVLFLATLTIWSFYHARPRGAGRGGGRARAQEMGEDEGDVGDGEDVGEEEEEDEEEIIWDAKIHMHQLLEYMIRSEPRELLKISTVTGRRNCEFLFFSSSSLRRFCLIEEKKKEFPPFTDSCDSFIRHRRFNSHRRRTIE